MKNSFLVLLFFVVFSTTAQNKYEATISKSVDEMAQAMLTKDYDVLIKYTYHKIVSLSGGPAILKEALVSGMERMEAGGVKYIDVVAGKAQKIFVAGDELHCLVPLKIVLTNGKLSITSNAYLLAISGDNGKTWEFVDTAAITNESVKELLPNFNTALRIPEKSKPVVKDLE